MLANNGLLQRVKVLFAFLLMPLTFRLYLRFISSIAWYDYNGY